MIVVAACFRTETIWIPHLSGADIVRTPMGEAAYDVLEEALDARESPTMILSTGFCGGVDPSLRTGEIVLAEQILYQQEEITVNHALVSRAQQALKDAGIGVVSGRTSCTEKMASKVDEKSNLRKKGVIAVDMESGILARLAKVKGIDFLMLRGVLDPASSSLPFTTNKCIGGSIVMHPLASLRLLWLSLIAGRVIGRAIPVVTRAFSGGVNE